MNRFRSILLSGLVALLMVGFVNAGDVDQGTRPVDVDGGIDIYIGTWDANTSQCLSSTASNCLKIGISIDFEWLKNLFN
ncbi:MAG: hypothetical protein ISR87_08115 [Candidatus Marinimicrobia bacterium]|nr:hypothetical protein [FCB group bacterium]MBL7025408.1 hypothetical protein [Candidatus Neomarinimicrobiota bacterium]